MHIPFQTIAFHIGPVPIYWYKIMYLIGLLIAYHGAKAYASYHHIKGMEDDYKYGILFVTIMVGMFLGGRIGYLLFYYTAPFTWNALQPDHGGMSFHGALVVAIASGIVACRIMKIPIMQASDAFLTFAPAGIALGRLGNFINGELWGRVTDVPWAMVFPLAGPQPRHPSQLYEMILEGIIPLFVLLLLYRKEMRAGNRTLIFLYIYCSARTFCETFRAPDPQIGFIFGGGTQGMLLTAFLLVGTSILHYFISRKTVSANS